MKKLSLDNKGFMIFDDVLSDQDRNKCFNDIKALISQGYVANNVPPLQTLPDLYDRVKHLPHWNTLYNFMKSSLQYSRIKGTIAPPINTQLESSWANLTVENGTYAMHKHSPDLTFCYFVRSEHPAYGTNIEGKFIIPSVENSMVIFNGDIEHSIINMPNELIPKNDYNRCSIVFDFNVIK